MALTPEDIERRQFTSSANGYNRDEVDAFLVETAASFRYAMQNLLPGVTPFGTDHATTDRAKPVEVAREVAEILEAASRASSSMIAEAENDATRVRASAEHHATQVREQADRDRERTKRFLLRSEEQAASIVSQAEEQAQQQRTLAERDSVRRTRDSLARAKRRADDLSLAEHQLIERLTELRGSIDAILRGESITAIDDPDTDASGAAAGTRPTNDVDVRPLPAAETSDEPPPEVEGPADRTSRLVRAAVQRAASTASGSITPNRRSPTRPTPETKTTSTF